MAEYLRHMPLFAAFSDEQLGDLQRQGKLIDVEAGMMLFHEGDPAQGLFVVLEGGLEVTKQSGAQEILLAHIPPGEFVGEISLLTGNPHGASVRATIDSRLLQFEPALFSSARNSPITRLLLTTMSHRMRNTEAAVRKAERLSSLGKLASGLAAELSTPAAESLSAVRNLPQALDLSHALALNVSNRGLSSAQLQALNALQRRMIATEPPSLTPAQRAERERLLNGWLDQHGCPDLKPSVPEFVAVGVECAAMDEVLAQVGADALSTVLRWLDATIHVVSLTRSLIGCSSRISDLIKSVKAYTYMDQSPTQEVDIHEGLENTLIMLRHRLAEVQIAREYDRALPRVIVFGSEINQVWTHLIDNAIDATNACGLLNLRTWREDDWIVVEVADNGCGISKDVQERIFTPYFTTKDVKGRRAGLGLDTVRRIVVERHRGMVRFSSIPGDTRFQVYLPLRTG